MVVRLASITAGVSLICIENIEDLWLNNAHWTSELSFPFTGVSIESLNGNSRHAHLLISLHNFRHPHSSLLVI